MLRLPLQAPPFSRSTEQFQLDPNCLVDESACVPHRYHGINDTFLHSLSIMYLFVSNLLLNINFGFLCSYLSPKKECVAKIVCFN